MMSGASKNITRVFITIVFLGILFIISFYSLKQTYKTLQATISPIEFSSSDRILILTPHPDDEVIACGGIIQKARELGLPLKIVYLTYGDNNQWSFLVYRKHPVIMPKAAEGMGMIRREEALRSAKVFGVSPEQLIFLGYPDFHTLEIWNAHWGDSPPEKGFLTKTTSVPYTNAFRPGAPYKGEEILKDLKAILNGFKPTKIFLSHPSDHNPDHKALYLFARVALWDLEGEMRPKIYPFLIHYKNWPLPRGYSPGWQITPPDILRQDIAWQTYRLGAEEISRKYAAIKADSTQYNSSAEYLLSFIRSNELFGDFPAVKLFPEDKLKSIPGELIDEEQASFAGIEERSVRLEDDNLVISIKLSRPIGRTVGVSAYVFGYRKDKNFSEMPKLNIRFGAVGHKVFDQNKTLPPDSIKTKRAPKEITISIPIGLLGDPQKILTSAQTYLGDISLDWVSWRVLEIQR